MPALPAGVAGHQQSGGNATISKITIPASTRSARLHFFQSATKSRIGTPRAFGSARNCVREGRASVTEPADEDGPFVQVSRMANPLVNELIITTPFKDGWNAAEPQDEAIFQAFYQNPVVATELNLVYHVAVLPIDGSPAGNRTDLMSLLLKYPGQALNGTNYGQPCAELLRLDLRVPPTAPEQQSRLGAALSADKAGYPNGRRPNDDVTDITFRVVGGTNYIAARIGDGVNFLADAPGWSAWTSRQTASPRTSRSSPHRTTASAAPVRAVIPAYRQCPNRDSDLDS